MPRGQKHFLPAPVDPRLYQLAALSGLFAYGLAALDFRINVEHAGVIFLGALLVQWIGNRWTATAFDWRSPAVSALSLCLLLRTDVLGLAAAAAAIAIASKFLIRWRSRHFLNPTGFALVVITTSFDQAWLTPGQWGHGALLYLLIAGVGLVVITRAQRLDTSVGFLATYAVVCLGRAIWLGDPMAIPLHQLGNGALLLFAFFSLPFFFTRTA